MERIKNAANFIKSKLGEVPEIAIILGSGLNNLAELFENKTIIDYKDIPGFPVSTVAGHKGRFIVGELAGKKVMAMQGRFHYYEGNTMEDVVLPVRVMKVLGIKNLIVTNAAGAVNTSFRAGNLMLITDHINMLGTNPLIGKNYDEFGPRFPDMSDSYNKKDRLMVKEIAKGLGVDLKEGVYCAMTGPCYETPAEVRMARIIGADAVGMSTVPEVIVANHAGIKVIGISCLTNMAAGILDQPLCHEEVMEASNMASTNFEKLVSAIVAAL
ncbi:MAG: purine nucleoside phosphorylase [Clostridiales bacterium]|jgi:purine-nucleoside phosphorylase|nr:purine nucleoside phosphorylase [Clostridiales bacterium]